MLRQGVIVLALLLAGCGSGGGDDPSQRLTKDNITQKMTYALVAEGSMHLEMTVEAGAQRITMSGDQRFGQDVDDLAMSMTYSETGEDPLEMRLVDGLIYANFGDTSEGKFVRVDPKDASSPMGRTFAPMMDDLDITTSIRQFSAAITAVEQNGDDKSIDGIATTPYEVTMDVDRAIESGALEKDTKLRSGASFVYTFYLDADDRLRRMESSVGSAVVRMDITKLGEPVDITEPSADQIIDESTFMDAA